MSLMSALKKILSSTQKNDSDHFKVFASNLHAAIAIVSDYGAVMERPNPEDGLGPLRSEKHLPHSKDSIKWAVTFLKAVISSSAGRAELIRVLPPDEAQYALSEIYAKSLDTVFAFLDFYVAESDLSEQRKQALEIADFVNELDPDKQKGLEEVMKIAKAVSNKTP